MSGDETEAAPPPSPRRRRTAASAMLRTARRMLLALIVLLTAWVGGLIWFAHKIPRAEKTVVSEAATDAVVVLTGGPLRLREGLDLLDHGKAKKLFVSGVSRNVELSELLRTAQKTPDAVACCITLGHAAADTAGNAAETRQWMENEGFHSLRLVTASYHMQRSLLEFHRAMPEFQIVPHPVFQERFMRSSWWAWPGTLALIVSEYQKYIAAGARFWLVTEAHKADARRIDEARGSGG
jgi:uncharacterized SAM-binding protein YcdF (DUF218 family)